MPQNTTKTTSSTAANNPQRIINEINPPDEYRHTAERILDRSDNANYVRNNPVRSALAALVIAGEDAVSPVVTRDHLDHFDVRVESLRDAEITLRETSNNQITPDTGDELPDSLDVDGSVVDRAIEHQEVHSHIDRIGDELNASRATIRKAYNLTRVTQPRDHNYELIAGAAVYLASHYTDSEYFTQTAIEDVTGTSGQLGRVSAHLAGFEYWSRKCVDDDRNVNSLPIVTYITDYCDSLGVSDAVREFAVDLIVEFEVIDGRWHLPAIHTALECMGTLSAAPTNDVYPEYPTQKAIEDRKEYYFDDIGRQRATRTCALYAVEDITESEQLEADAKAHIETELSDVLFTELSAMEIADLAVNRSR